MAILDRNGVAINVGDTVRLIGTVLSLDPADTHFGEVKIQLTNPLAGPPNYVPNPEVAGFPPTVTGADRHGPRAAQIIKCAPLTLIH